MTDAEKVTLELFQRCVDGMSASGSSTDDWYAARILQNINVGRTVYNSTSHVSPTSNCVERLFSMCKRTMSSLRKKMGPEILEGSVILRTNSELWRGSAAVIIQEILNEEVEANRAVGSSMSPDVSDIITMDIDEELAL